MFYEKVPKPVYVPTCIDELCVDMEKLMKVVNNAIEPAHFIAAENMLGNFSEKWMLNKGGKGNPICVAINERIVKKRNEFISMDYEYANGGSKESNKG